MKGSAGSAILVFGTALAVSVTTGCASLPPEAAPELRRALQDTATATRVYQVTEVEEPVISAPNQRPASFLQARDGRAVFRFVVDTTGRVEVRTIEMQPGSEPTIAREVYSMLHRWRYLPARLADGRYVRQLAELTVTKAGSGVVIRLSTDAP